jgi:hypothetical protein
MSDTSATPARPVSLFTIVLLMLVFAAFLLVIRWFYHPAATTAFNGTPENLPKDMEWRANTDARRKTLHETREKEAKDATTYGWVDKSAGVVRLPIDRAMELTAEKYATKK